MRVSSVNPPTESHKPESHPGGVSVHVSEGCETFAGPAVPSAGPAPVEVGGAVHGQARHAVQEVSEGEVDDEDGGVLERSSVEAEYLVGLSPGDGEESQEVTTSSDSGHYDAPEDDSEEGGDWLEDSQDPGEGGEADTEGVDLGGLWAGTAGEEGRVGGVGAGLSSHCSSPLSSGLQTTELRELFKQDRRELRVIIIFVQHK